MLRMAKTGRIPQKALPCRAWEGFSVALFFFLSFALEEHGVAEGENSTFLLASPIPAIL